MDAATTQLESTMLRHDQALDRKDRNAFHLACRYRATLLRHLGEYQPTAIPLVEERHGT